MDFHCFLHSWPCPNSPNLDNLFTTCIIIIISVCGTDKGSIDMTNYPYLYYVNDYLGGVCVKTCPKLGEGLLADPYTLVTYGGLFQVNGSNDNVTTALIDIADYSNTNNTLVCTADLCYPNTDDPTSSYTSIGVNGGRGFAYYALDTYEVMWRCVFRDDATKKLNEIVNPKTSNNFTAEVVEDITTQNDHIKQGYDIWHNLFGDLWETRYFILGLGFGAPLVRRAQQVFQPQHYSCTPLPVDHRDDCLPFFTLLF